MTRPSRRPLTSEECSTLLSEIGWGVVAVVEHPNDGATPVAVPSAYAYDGERLFLTMTDGRKLRALVKHARVCLTVTDVRSLAQWRSVMVIGAPHWIRAAVKRRSAIAAFRAQAQRSGWPLAPADIARFGDAELMTIDVAEMHGFAMGAITASSVEPSEAAMNFLRRVVRSLRVERAQSESSQGVTGAQLFVLREVRKARTITVGELAQRMATGQSSVSEVVARLVKRGLLVRKTSRTDHRRAELRLSAAGRTLLDDAPASVGEGLLAAFRRLPESTRRTTAEGLERWIAEAGLTDVGATMLFESED